jgi:alpha-N-arabinofuranosidase
MRKYQNPVISGFYPDPSICRKDDDYYLVTSSFEYFPGVPLFHSKDLIHWEQIGYCLTSHDQLALGDAVGPSGIYAPTIRYHQDRFYMITTNCAAGGNFFVYTDNINHEWSPPVWIDKRGIDPSLFFDDDGKVYYTKTNFKEIVQAEIDPLTGKLLTPLRDIWQGTGGRYPEAPHLYKINGLYYLLLAEGGTEYGHMATIARSPGPWGPFEACPFNPILTHRNRGIHPIQATGHADLIQAHDGSWWVVCLAIRPHGYPPVHHLGRETFLSPVHWTETGWPVIYQDGTLELEMEAELLPPYELKPETYFDAFEKPEPTPLCEHFYFNLCWNFLRNPLPDNYSLTLRPGALALFGSHLTLNDPASPTFLGRRQKDINFVARTCIDFYPAFEGEEAGLTVFMNERHHYEIGILNQAEKQFVFVRKSLGDLSALVYQEELEKNSFILQIKGTEESYTFSYGVATPTGYCKPIATGLTRYLATEVAGGFTGVFLALYATGNGKSSRTPAFFDWFDYRPDAGCMRF